MDRSEVLDLESVKMAGHRDQTSMGGLQEAFLTTHWSLVEHIRADEDKNRVLIGLLLDRYWKPVYCYLRRKGHHNEEAKDLTQGFFHEVVLNRNLVQRAEQCKGRFRTFLLHALDQYLLNEQRRQDAQKRRPKGTLVSFRVLETPVLPEKVSELGPEESYNYAWTASMLDQVLSEVEAQCREDGLETHWHLFCAKVVQPIMGDGSCASSTEVCEKYGIHDQNKAANMITTVKRRLRKALQNYIRTTAASDDDVREEFSEMKRFFSKSAKNL